MAYTPPELEIAQRDPHRALANNVGRGAPLPPAGPRAAAVQPPNAGGGAAPAPGPGAAAQGGAVAPEAAPAHAILQNGAAEQRNDAAPAEAVGGFNRPA